MEMILSLQALETEDERGAGNSGVSVKCTSGGTGSPASSISVRCIDPLAIGAVLLALLLAGLAASLAPALRVARVHPMRVFHTD